MEELFFFIFIGLLVGALTGITGASGVLILVPVLSMSPVSNISMPIILGTSLMVDVIASFAVSSTYALAKNTEVKKVWGILAGTIIGTQIGAYIVISIPKVWIIIVIAIGMIAFGLKMLNQKKEKQENPSIPKNFLFSKKPIMMIFWGLIVGISTGLFGAGGGIMIFFVLFYFLKFTLKKAVGTSTFIMIFTSVFGVIGYIYHGNIDFHLSLILGFSAAIGGFISSLFANRIKDGALSRMIGVIFIFSALIMFVFKAVIPLL